MIFDNPESPVAYESLSSSDSSEESEEGFKKEFSERLNVLENFRTESCSKNFQSVLDCYHCKTSTEQIYSYRDRYYLCLKCCYFYDSKFKCTKCESIVFTNIWYKGEHGQICDNCNSLQCEPRSCKECKVTKNIKTWFGKNGTLCKRCYDKPNIRMICSLCNLTKSSKCWYNTKNGLICRMCQRTNKSII